jgi:hypothetical protein
MTSYPLWFSYEVALYPLWYSYEVVWNPLTRPSRRQ